MDVASVVSALAGQGIRPSHPRLRIYDFLWENRIHPTADEVYARLHPANPTLSRTTVYNTLKLFVRKGVVDPVIIEDNEMRYDIEREVHGHFKCGRCGKVYDIPLDAGISGRVGVSGRRPLQPDPSALQGFKIDHKHFYYHGTCRPCLEKSNSKNNNKTKRRVS
jgi:Fur family transcriptional regulator, peroxide stress response regulator